MQCDDVGTMERGARCLSISQFISQAEPNRTPCRPEFAREPSALGPGLPEPTSERVPPNPHRHSLPVGYRMVKRSVLGGLHHEYGLAKEAA